LDIECLGNYCFGSYYAPTGGVVNLPLILIKSIIYVVQGDPRRRRAYAKFA
jgi:hypothetical protein